jgi:hypothetical protein
MFLLFLYMTGTMDQYKRLPYRALATLPRNHVYEVVQDRVIQEKMLILRDAIDQEPFEALLLDPDLHEPFRRIRQLNSVLNSEETPYGCSTVGSLVVAPLLSQWKAGGS